MDKFWDWMEKKEYDHHFRWYSADEYTSIGTEAKCSNQMIIGYMIEYLLSHSKSIPAVTPDYNVLGYYTALKYQIEGLEV